MQTPGSGTEQRRLRAVAEAPAPGREALVRAVEACAAADPAGVPAAELRDAVAARLGVPPEDVARDDVMAALGTLIATGRVDESAGRLVAVTQESRRAG